MKVNVDVNLDKGMIEQLICAILPTAVKDSPGIKKMFSAEVQQVLVESSYFGHPDPRNGFKRDDCLYRVTVVNGVAVACTCYGFHYHGHCKHQVMGEHVAFRERREARSHRG